MCKGFYDKWRYSALFGFQNDDIPKSYSVLFKQLAKSIGTYGLIFLSYCSILWVVKSDLVETNETYQIIVGILGIPIIILGIAIGIGFVAILFSFVVVIFKKLFKQ
jgi:TRAP-type C4-dicarboxylate transport system permease small subunit